MPALFGIVLIFVDARMLGWDARVTYMLAGGIFGCKMLLCVVY